MKGISSKYLNELALEINEYGARPASIDSILNSYNKIEVESDRVNLISMLSDSAEYDEGMFSIIHFAESIDDESYVSALLQALPNLAVRAPRWSSILLMRVMNNTVTFKEFCRKIDSADSNEKTLIRNIANSIVQKRPQFSDRAELLFKHMK
jgi:hypothetical protein